MNASTDEHRKRVAAWEFLATQSLYRFTQWMWPELEPGVPLVLNWHIRLLCDELEAVVRGDVNRLLINVPPGLGKTWLGGYALPAWGGCGSAEAPG